MCSIEEEEECGVRWIVRRNWHLSERGSSPRVSKGVVQVSRANALPNGRATAPIYAPTPYIARPRPAGYIAMCEV